MLKDAQGNLLTRKDLHNPATLLEATIFADRHFRVPRFGLRNKLSRAIAAFLSAPEIK
jgi:hypothetical protein